MAAAIWSGPTRVGSYTTEAASVARLTSASSTPSSLARTFSTRRTQDAQVMPPMSSVHDSVAVGSAVGVVVMVCSCARWVRGWLSGCRGLVFRLVAGPPGRTGEVAGFRGGPGGERWRWPARCASLARSARRASRMSCPTWSRTSCSWMAVMAFSSGVGLGGWVATVGVGRLRQQRVAGLVDGGGDVGLVDGLVGGDGEGAGLDVDGDGLDAGEGADLAGDGGAA